MIVKNTHGLIFCWQRIDHTPTLLEYDITPSTPLHFLRQCICLDRANMSNGMFFMFWSIFCLFFIIFFPLIKDKLNCVRPRTASFALFITVLTACFFVYILPNWWYFSYLVNFLFRIKLMQTMLMIIDPFICVTNLILHSHSLKFTIWHLNNLVYNYTV